MALKDRFMKPSANCLVSRAHPGFIISTFSSQDSLHIDLICSIQDCRFIRTDSMEVLQKFVARSIVTIIIIIIGLVLVRSFY